MSHDTGACLTAPGSREPSPAVSALPGFDPSRDYRGVCYRAGKPTVADYNEAIESLLAAKHQLQSGDLMGCAVCGDTGHASQDGCHHDPLVLARQWAAATAVYQCYHCGFVATNDAEAREHFGRNEYDDPACDSDTRRKAETGTGSVRSTGSAAPEGIAQAPSHPSSGITQGREG